MSQPLYEPLTNESYETLDSHRRPVDRLPSAYEVPQGESLVVPQESLYADADLPVPEPHPTNNTTISNATYELWDENDDGRTQV